MNAAPEAFLALIAFAVGAHGVITFFRYRRYVNTLPPTTGNRQIRRQQVIWLVVGLAMMTFGAWITLAALVF